ncbi:hypothetical protein Spith_1660 [Spirochaeta thermophila DSM 6578]|uniref:WGR domain-containing protein n=1 Tax=Winmispira thermophila (strain ATCC 700085 / DSM 6578 / Z-1203) TaxID=869211 RepID=G0GBB1_WINT7|nr:WGR domain-containing protein [Spirochaeta thermophila]AEJ61920.1 hypothetical protein Spith_1660 [Spirochaeta thermophila DSM 6578]
MQIVLYKKAKDTHTHYYEINDRQLHLFSNYGFTVRWWREGASSRERHYSFPSRSERDSALQRLLQRKYREGYRVLYHYFRHRLPAALPGLLRRMGGG